VSDKETDMGHKMAEALFALLRLNFYKRIRSLWDGTRVRTVVGGVG